ncbi:PilX N-terminal domain-containing pilus assembly protein [Pseudomonadota bacterium]
MKTIKTNPHLTNMPMKQRGVASLVISLAILTLLTFITLYTSKSILTEQKLAHNDMQAKQAFEVAEAGIAAASTSLTEDMDLDDDGFVDGTTGDATTAPAGLFDLDGNGTREASTLTIGDYTVAVTITDNSTSEVTILDIQAVATGLEGTSNRTITQTVVLLNAVANDPDVPLTAKGTVTLGGSANSINSEGHSTVWSGGNVDLTNASTEIPDVSAGNYPGCMDDPDTNPCTTVATSSQTVMGLDVIEFDSSIGNLTTGELFENFFGRSMEQFKDRFVSINTTHTNAANDWNAGTPGAHLATQEAIWIDGSGGTTELNGVTVGCESDVNSDTCTLAEREPSIMVIDGNATFKGNSTFYGIVFVTGNVLVSGNTTIVGAIVGAGAITTTGSLDVIYNSNVLTALDPIGTPGGSAGGWRDI